VKEKVYPIEIFLAYPWSKNINDTKDEVPEFIVAEVSKNWPDPEAFPYILCRRFEEVIAHNRQRGYLLHSFSLHRLMTGPKSMNETIIAVFRRTG
jgi:hypothetical protein